MSPGEFTLSVEESKQIIVNAVAQFASIRTISNLPGHTYSVDDESILIIGNTPADYGCTISRGGDYFDN